MSVSPNVNVIYGRDYTNDESVACTALTAAGALGQHASFALFPIHPGAAIATFLGSRAVKIVDNFFCRVADTNDVSRLIFGSTAQFTADIAQMSLFIAPRLLQGQLSQGKGVSLKVVKRIQKHVSGVPTPKATSYDKIDVNSNLIAGVLDAINFFTVPNDLQEQRKQDYQKLKDLAEYFNVDFGPEVSLSKTTKDINDRWVFKAKELHRLESEHFKIYQKSVDTFHNSAGEFSFSKPNSKDIFELRKSIKELLKKFPKTVKYLKEKQLTDEDFSSSYPKKEETYLELLRTWLILFCRHYNVPGREILIDLQENMGEPIEFFKNSEDNHKLFLKVLQQIGHLKKNQEKGLSIDKEKLEDFERQMQLVTQKMKKELSDVTELEEKSLPLNY